MLDFLRNVKGSGIKKHKSTLLVFVCICLLLFFLLSYSMKEGRPALSPYPDGKNFAFTITDDPDFTKLEKIEVVYEFLTRMGLRTTVAVWVNDAAHSNGVPDVKGKFNYGDTLQREAYRDYILELHKRGFEVAVHGVSGGNDLREDIIKGYEEFKALFGYYPKINIMHSNNLENMYWGPKVFNSSIVRWAFRNLVGLVYTKAKIPFAGANPESSYFWGDILKEKTKYVRLWGTTDINTLKFNPSMPYHDPDKPYVNYWFSFSDGINRKFFCKIISDSNIERLVKERGACILYTHFGCGFCKKAKDGSYLLDETVQRQIRKIAQQKDGWFVPASVVLDRLLLMKNVSLISTKNAFIVVNANKYLAEGVTILVHPKMVLFNLKGERFEANEEGEIILGDLEPGESVALFKYRGSYSLKNSQPSLWEHLKLVLRRSLILLFSHSG